MTVGNLKLLADLYHLGTMSEDLSAVAARYADEYLPGDPANTPGSFSWP
jgi:hypothetical protein